MEAPVNLFGNCMVNEIRLQKRIEEHDMLLLSSYNHKKAIVYG